MKKKCLECTHLNSQNARKCKKCGHDFSSGGWAMDDGNDSSDTLLNDYKDKDFGKSFKSNALNKVNFPSKMNVDVKDIDMSFGNMVMFMVKWAIASIPAVIILVVIIYISFIALGVILSPFENY